MLRSLLGVKLEDKINVQKIREFTGSRDIGWTVKKLKLGYAEHLARSPAGKWNTELVGWYPRGLERRVGKPSTRWRDEIHKRFGSLWQRTARNRLTWRQAVKAYTRDWVDPTT